MSQVKTVKPGYRERLYVPKGFLIVVAPLDAGSVAVLTDGEDNPDVAGPFNVSGSIQQVGPFASNAKIDVSVISGEVAIDVIASVAGGGGGVTSIFGRTGIVGPQVGDYTFAQIGSKPTTLAGYGITDAAAAGHTHGSSAITDFAAAADARVAAAVNNTVEPLRTVASQAEAEAGTLAAVRAWTPERIKQAILALAPVGGGGGGASVVQEGDVTVVSAATTLDFLGADFDVTETPAGEANIAIAAAIARLASPAFTGTPTAPTPTAGNNSTLLATTAFVQAAIAALVNASPAALDTLNELAAALGNDANFSTTMTNALAAKAPLASPALTGTPTAPTAAGGTDTTQLATTAFTRAEILSRVLTGLAAAGATAGPASTDTMIAAWGKVLRLFNVLAGGATGEVLKKNSATNFDWAWAADNTGGGSLTVQEGDATVSAAVSTLDFGAGFDVTESPAGEANIALDLSEVAPVVVNESTTARTLTAADNGKIIVCTNASPTTITVGTAFSGLSCLIVRGSGAGTVTIAASSTTLIASSLVINAAGLSAVIAPTQTANEFTVTGNVGDIEAGEENIASAATTTLANTASQNVNITGTTGISSFGNAPAGMRRWGRFAGALTLTEGANLILNNGGSNITTAAGDRFYAYTSAANTWVVNVIKRSGAALSGGGGGGDLLAANNLSELTATAATARSNIGAAPLASPTFTGTVTLPGDPASALQAATKQYVDGLAANVGKRSRVRAATTANITISTALNNADTLDGVTLNAGDLVLVKDQTAPAENGVYVVGASPARATEFDTYNEHPGSLIAVAEGTANADTVWLCTSNDGGTLNTTGIVFSKLNVAGTLLASNNLSDLANAATAWTNLGGDERAQDAVGAAMVLPSGAYDDTGNSIRIPHTFCIACSDETTALAAGAGKVFWHMPFAMTVVSVMAGLTTPQTSGAIFTVDVNEGAGAGTSILSTKLTIDNTEETSLTAATAPVISDTALAKGSRMSVDIDQIGDGTAKGLKVYLVGFITGF